MWSAPTIENLSIAFEAIRRLSSSTLVSEECVLPREKASLSLDSTDEVVDVESFLRCFDCLRFVEVINIDAWDCPRGSTGGWLRGDTMESRIMILPDPVGGDMS